MKLNATLWPLLYAIYQTVNNGIFIGKINCHKKTDNNFKLLTSKKIMEKAKIYQCCNISSLIWLDNKTLKSK